MPCSRKTSSKPSIYLYAWGMQKKVKTKYFPLTAAKRKQGSALIYVTVQIKVDGK